MVKGHKFEMCQNVPSTRRFSLSDTVAHRNLSRRAACPQATRRCSLKVADPESFLKMLKQQIQWVVVLSKLQLLKSLASELFLGPIEVEIESDPELDCSYVTFHVTIQGDPGESGALRREWYHRTLNLLKNDCDKVRLVISVE